MLQAVDGGRFPPVPDTGNRRSMVHVEDLAVAAWLAATVMARSGRVYIVSDGLDYSTRQLYEWMCIAFGRKPAGWSIPVSVLRAAAASGDMLEQITGRSMPLNRQLLQRLLGSACYRADRLRAELGWQPRWSFQQALPAMVEAYRGL
jgi:nucleoside-diphosphate-sugar epimerase